MAASKLLGAKAPSYDPNGPFVKDVRGFSDAEIMANAKKMPRRQITQKGAKLTGGTDPALAAGGGGLASPFDTLNKAITDMNNRKGK